MLVYDGQCRFCEHCVDVIRRWDRAGRVAAVPFQDVASWKGIPGLSREALERAMHLVSPTGGVFAGAAAARPLLALLPGGRILAAPLALPGAERVAAAGYHWIARHRHRLGCGSRVCHRGD